MHADPEGQAVHDGPHARTLLVASTHEVPQSRSPGAQVETHAPPEQAFDAFVAEHAAQWPPQQIPTSQPSPSATSPVATQVDCPELHDRAPT
jgi:hypothetical protein